MYSNTLKMNRITFKIFVITLLAFLCLTACWAQKKQHGKASYYSKELQEQELQAVKDYITTV